MSKKTKPEAEEQEQVKTEAPAEETAKADAKPATDWEAKYNDLNDRYLRMAAEYDNFRKRSAREQDAAFGNGVVHAVSQILSILDTLEMAEAAPTADENFKKGVTLTLEKAKAAFEALKVEEIGRAHV